MKDELRLAFKAGALAIIYRQELTELDDATKEKMNNAIDGMFETWYKGMAPLFALTSVMKEPESSE